MFHDDASNLRALNSETYAERDYKNARVSVSATTRIIFDFRIPALTLSNPNRRSYMRDLLLPKSSVL